MPKLGMEENRTAGVLSLKRCLENDLVPVPLPLIRISRQLSQIGEPPRDGAIALGKYLWH